MPPSLSWFSVSIFWNAFQWFQNLPTSHDLVKMPLNRDISLIQNHSSFVLLLLGWRDLVLLVWPIETIMLSFLISSAELSILDRLFWNGADFYDIMSLQSVSQEFYIQSIFYSTPSFLVDFADFLLSPNGGIWPTFQLWRGAIWIFKFTYLSIPPISTMIR